MIKRKDFYNNTSKSTRNGEFVEQELYHDKTREDKRVKTAKKDLNPLNENQDKYFKALWSSQLVVVLGPAGTGKAQPLYSKILTPEGWKFMGDMKKGDSIICADGTTSQVQGIYPQGKKPIYEVIFENGSRVRCCDEHLWRVFLNLTDNNDSEQVLDTRTLLTLLHKNVRVYTPICSPIEKKGKDLPLLPYLVGSFIGYQSTPSYNDGCEILKNNEHLVEGLTELELIDVPVNKEFIPDCYLESSITDRLGLLRGILDVGGYVDVLGGTSYSTASLTLANQLYKLTRELGNYSKLTTIETESTPKYVVHIKFRDKDSTRKLSNEILGIRYIEEDECQCIYVDHPDHLYITDGYEVTHNTYIPSAMCADMYKNRQISQIVLSRPMEGPGRAIGTLPGPQPLWSKVLTSEGWKSMGEIMSGDLVATPDGTFVKVISTHDQGEKDIYKVVTSTGDETHCCLDHLWEVAYRDSLGNVSPFSVISTQQILDKINRGVEVVLPKIREIPFRERTLSIPPYEMGTLLSGRATANEGSIEKAIPDCYKFSSKSQRYEIVKGIIGINQEFKGDILGAIISTDSKVLAQDLKEVVLSLGGTVNLSCKDGESFVVCITLREGSDSHVRKIESIVKVGPEDCRCISIDSERNLYLTDDFIPTHNTKDEKMHDWLIPLTSTIRARMGPGTYDYALKSKDIDLCPLNQIKGRSFDDSFVIIDEAEDIDIDTMKSVVTRIGQGTKVVINGDIKQKHIKQESGLGWLVSLVRKYNLPVPIIEFTVEDCVRGPITKMFLEVFELEADEEHYERNNRYDR